MTEVQSTRERHPERPQRSDEPAAGQPLHHLDELYARYQHKVYRQCFALLRNPSDAEDATQETFLRLARHLGHLSEDVSAYVRATARSVCCDIVRAQSKSHLSIDGLTLADPGRGPDEHSAERDFARQIWHQLTTSEKVLFAHTVAGFRYRETARRTGLSESGVSVAISRARQRLRAVAGGFGGVAVIPALVHRWLARVGRRAHLAANDAAAMLSAATVQQAATLAVSVAIGITALSLHDAEVGPSVVPGPVTGTVLATGGVAHPMPDPPGHIVAALPPAVAPVSRMGAPHASTTPLPLPAADATPDNTAVHDMVASPNYADDHTVYASAEALGPCLDCSVLFRSTDGARTWTDTHAVGFRGGHILLPPGYPRDPAIYSVDGNTLSKADGSLATPVFRPVLPGVTTAAFDPTSTLGSTRLAGLTAGSLVLYSDASVVRVTPGPALPLEMLPSSLAYIDATHLIVAGTLSRPLTGETEVVTVCTLGKTCGPPSVLAEESSTPTLVPSPRITYDGMLTIYTVDRIFVSHDRGLTFTSTSLDASHSVREVTVGAWGPTIQTAVVEVDNDVDGGSHPVLSIGGGSQGNATPITGNLLPKGNVNAVTFLPDGHILAAVYDALSLSPAIRCSAGDGIWRSACA